MKTAAHDGYAVTKPGYAVTKPGRDVTKLGRTTGGERHVGQPSGVVLQEGNRADQEQSNQEGAA